MTRCRPSEANQPPAVPPIVEPLKLSTETLNYISQGAILKTPEDQRMLDETYPGIDLTYSNNQTVAQIRAIPNRRLRMMMAIGFLNVEGSGRYNRRDDLYTCNVYSLDFLRLILGNDIIGSRYNLITGEPTVFDINDID
ncbi:MAG: hypothetical protein QHH09_03840 [Microgenomates group bacterium]|nr:hypothetical protein [Microgenomates group bacterium]